MQVKDSVHFPEYPGYSIEWGIATWNEEDTPEDEADFSIRNRYSNQNGGFNYRGSAEIPMWDFKRMIIESIRRKHLEEADIADILSAISENMR